MEAIEAMLTRRSIRRGFTRRTVEEHIVRRIVECGLHAPSSKNDQPWRIHTVTEPAFGDVVATAMAASPRQAEYVPLDPETGLARPEFVSSVIESAGILRSASLVLVIENAGLFTGGRRAVARGGAALEETLVGYGFEYLGLGAAIQNMWLAAHASGLRGTFLGDVLIAEDNIRRWLNLDGELVGVLALGYSDARPHAEKAIKPGRNGSQC